MILSIAAAHLKATLLDSSARLSVTRPRASTRTTAATLIATPATVAHSLAKLLIFMAGAIAP